jgi:DNA-binding Xre family transcriptional regulator
MRDRSMTVETLRRRAAISAETIAALRNNTGQQVSYRALGAICAELGVTLDQLFELIPEDIWAPIRTGREVTIHYGSRAWVESLPGQQHGRARDQVRQYIGVWDQRAINLIGEHLHRAGSEVYIAQEEHVTWAGRGSEPEAPKAARKAFAQGNHVLIGSPMANQFAEEVVCLVYDVPPHAPAMRDRFPYGFVWESHVASSFGWKSEGGELGIASTRTNTLLAPRTTVLDGYGRDCALVLVHRILPRERSPGEQRRAEGERVIIAILGHTGLGTYAGAKLAIDPAWSARW